MSVTEFKRGVPTYKDKDDNEYGLLCETKEVCVTDNDGVSLEYKLQTLMQNIASLTSDLANYFPRSGGELKGNLTLKITDATAALSHRQITPKRDIEYAILPDGSYGILDNTNSKWIFTSSLDGSNILDATATGNLPLNGGGTVSSNNDTPITIKSKTSKNVYQRFVNSEGTGWYFGFDEKGARIVGQGYLLHTGNSAKVVVSQTAPSDTSALWVW